MGCAGAWGHAIIPVSPASKCLLNASRAAQVHTRLHRQNSYCRLSGWNSTTLSHWFFFFFFFWLRWVFIAVCRLLIAAASRCRARALGAQASVVVVRSLSSCGAWA